MYYHSSVCGRVEKSIFQPGSCDETGVDAAVVKISDRRPRDGNFIWVSPESQTAAGNITILCVSIKFCSYIQFNWFKSSHCFRISVRNSLKQSVNLNDSLIIMATMLVHQEVIIRISIWLNVLKFNIVIKCGGIS